MLKAIDCLLLKKSTPAFSFIAQPGDQSFIIRSYLKYAVCSCKDHKSQSFSVNSSVLHHLWKAWTSWGRPFHMVGATAEKAHAQAVVDFADWYLQKALLTRVQLWWWSIERQVVL